MRKCLNCGSNKTHHNNHGSEMWCKHDDGYLCTKCYSKLKLHPKWNHVNNPRRILFNHKRVMLKDNPRTGICSWCGKQGKTDMHHTQYDGNDPLKHAVELCVSCHSKEGNRLGQLNSLFKKTVKGV